MQAAPLAAPHSAFFSSSFSSSLCRPCAACHVESWSFPSRSFFAFFSSFRSFFGFFWSYRVVPSLSFGFIGMSCAFFFFPFLLFFFLFFFLLFSVAAFCYLWLFLLCHAMCSFCPSLLSSFGFLSCLRTLNASLGVLLIFIKSARTLKSYLGVLSISVMSADLEISWRPFDFCLVIVFIVVVCVVSHFVVLWSFPSFLLAVFSPFLFCFCFLFWS